jgi:predicted amidohydrolase
VLAKYRKVNTWIPWEIHTSPHDVPDYPEEPFPVVQTPLGRLGVAICYDWLFPETIRQIAFNGAEVILRVSAYMDPWGANEPMDWWTLINRTRALENTTYVVAANQGARFENYPPFSWPGSSMVVDYDGRILAQAEAGPGEKVVIAPIDIDALRAERERRIGHDMRSHLRSSIHPYLGREYLAPAGGDQPLSKAGIEARIRAARQRSQG